MAMVWLQLARSAVVFMVKSARLDRRRKLAKRGERARARRAGGPHARRRTPDPRRLAIRACFTTEGGSSVGLFVLRHDSYAISRQSASSLVFCTGSNQSYSRSNYTWNNFGSNIRIRLATLLEEAFVEMCPTSSVVQTLPPKIRNREKQRLDW